VCSRHKIPGGICTAERSTRPRRNPEDVDEQAVRVR
jgi:hypothetical protein